MNDLVSRLTTGKHPVEVVLRPEQTMDAFRAAVQRGYVHVKFTGTMGGTELGVRLDAAQSELNPLALDTGRGRVQVSGPLTLDYEPVTCVAVIDLPELTGEGWLERGHRPPAATPDA